MFLSCARPACASFSFLFPPSLPIFHSFPSPPSAISLTYPTLIFAHLFDVAFVQGSWGDRSASGCKSHANKVKPKLSRGLCLGQGAILFSLALCGLTVISLLAL